MNFSTVKHVTDTIFSSDEVERIRAENRVKVDQMFNGAPPLSADEAKKWNLKVNVNFGEGPVLAAHARRQYTNAFQRPGVAFRVTLPLAPDEKATEWAMEITEFINRILKRSKPYFHLKLNQFSSVVAHGPGAQLWDDNDSWCPDFMPIGDLRLATDTELSLENVEWFSARHRYSEGELTEKVFGEHSDQHWRKAAIKKLLWNYHDRNYENQTYDWMNAPEKMAELVKQNLGYYSSDAVPTIPLWHFYYRDRDKRKENWKLVVVPDQGVLGTYETDEFFYKSDKPFADKLDHILHIQFGDLNNKAPFLYHSIRSLGFLLMEPCFYTNLTRCRLLQHTFEQFNVWLRSVDPSGRARAQKVELFDRAFIPEGISIVPQTERHQIDARLVETVMAQLKQLMAEASASYVQSTDNGTQKEQTAFETSVKLQQVNAMMSGMLTVAFFQETFAYREICRRFCLRGTTDPDCIKFQKHCRELGIPRIWLNVELWDIEPEIPLGAGNPSMAQAEANQLMQQREKYDPTAQQEILHDFTAVVTSNPRKAARLVPLDSGRGVTDAQRDAEFAFATLMHGVPVRMKEGLSAREQVETLLGLMAGVIARIEKQTNLATPSELAGLQQVGQYVNGLIQQLAQNKEENQRVKQYSDVLGKLMNSLKAFAQRLQEQQKASQQNPEAIAKAETTKMLAEVKAHTSAASAAQKMHQKQIGFDAEQKRKDAQTAAELRRQNLKAGHEVGVEHAKAAHEIRREAVKTHADVKLRKYAAYHSQDDGE
jgi:hypothetical protein